MIHVTFRVIVQRVIRRPRENHIKNPSGLAKATKGEKNLKQSHPEKKRRRRPSTSSDSSSDSVSSKESLHEQKSRKPETKGKLCVPENAVNISDTQYSQVQRQREQCSLTELATIAVAINKGKGEWTPLDFDSSYIKVLLNFTKRNKG